VGRIRYGESKLRRLLPLALLLCALPALGQGADNLYCGSNGVPTWGSMDGPANLPTSCFYTAMSATPSPGTVRTVTAGSSCTTNWTNLNTVIDVTGCGDIVIIPAGHTYCGDTAHHFPTTCDAAHWITLETDQLSNPNFPAEGTMATPCQINIASLPGRPSYPCSSPAQLMPTLQITNPAHAFFEFAAGGEKYMRLIGLETTVDSTQTTANYTQLVHLGSSSGIGTSTGHDHIIDRSILHGSELPNAPDPTGAPLQVQAGVTVNGPRLAIIDSYLYDFYTTSASSSTDAQCFVGGGGNLAQGIIKVVNTFCEGSSEGFLFGGGAATVNPTDVEIRLNTFNKPLQWRCDPVAGCPPAGHVLIKNGIEVKNAVRFLIEGNTLMYAWNGPGTSGATQGDQNGSGFLLTPKNQGGNCPLCIVSDVVFRYNHLLHFANGFQFAAIPSDSGAFDLGALRNIAHDNLLEDINGTFNPSNDGADGMEFIANGGIPASGQLASTSVVHNTFLLNGPGGKAGAGWTLQSASSPVNYTNFIFRDNITAAPFYIANPGFTTPSVTSIFNTANPTLNWCVQGNLVTTGNWTGEGTNPSWPTPSDNPIAGACHNGAVNNVTTGYTTIGFTNYNGGNGGNYQLLNTSPYHNTASDGTDPGANIAQLNFILGGSRAPGSFGTTIQGGVTMSGVVVK
jgi:hypothetical protein